MVFMRMFSQSGDYERATTKSLFHTVVLLQIPVAADILFLSHNVGHNWDLVLMNLAFMVDSVEK